jgi:hypothetical protein
MVDVSSDSLKWQIIRDFEGSRLEVVCPLCGERVLYRLDDLEVDEEIIIGLALEQHFYMCQRQFPTAVTIAASYNGIDNDDDVTSDELVFGVDEQLWHIVQGTTMEDEGFCEMEVIATDPMILDDMIESQRFTIAVAEYGIAVLEAAKLCNPPQ